MKKMYFGFDKISGSMQGDIKGTDVTFQYYEKEEKHTHE